MMKSFIARTVVVTAIAAALTATLAACGHRANDFGQHEVSASDLAKYRERATARAARMLDLDAAQQTKFAAMFDKVTAQRKTIQRTVSMRPDLGSLIATNQLDRNKAQALLSKETNASADGSADLINAIASFYDGLEPGQQAKLRRFTN
jgi:periplasmic protein CpxP/Spy